MFSTAISETCRQPYDNLINHLQHSGPFDHTPISCLLETFHFDKETAKTQSNDTPPYVILCALLNFRVLFSTDHKVMYDQGYVWNVNDWIVLQIHIQQYLFIYVQHSNDFPYKLTLEKQGTQLSLPVIGCCFMLGQWEMAEDYRVSDFPEACLMMVSKHKIM